MVSLWINHLEFHNKTYDDAYICFVDIDFRITAWIDKERLVFQKLNYIL